MTARQQEGISRLRWKPGATTAPVAGRRKLLWPVLLPLAVVAFVLAGYWVHNRVENALHHIVSEQLQTILEIDIAALEFWMQQESSTVISWAGEEHLRDMTQALQELAPEKLQTAPEQARLRELLEPLLDTDDYVGFGIFNSAGLILAAGAADERLIGQRLTPQGHAGLAGVFTQAGGWIEPFWRGQYIESESLQEDITLMGVSAAIADSAGRPLAALLLFVPPEKDFTRILSIARMGESGDTYAFDEKGRMLSDTRHLETLKTAGIVPDVSTVRAVLRVELRDPGGNLLKGYRTDTPMAGRPLTWLIADIPNPIESH